MSSETWPKLKKLPPKINVTPASRNTVKNAQHDIAV